jgi:hypothetical protein
VADLVIIMTIAAEWFFFLLAETARDYWISDRGNHSVVPRYTQEFVLLAISFIVISLFESIFQRMLLLSIQKPSLFSFETKILR